MPDSIPPAATSGSSAVVALQGVSVAYGKAYALRDVNATFQPGAVGLLGPNGAGKSTMIKSLLGFIRPTGGRMHVLGLDVTEAPLEIRDGRFRPPSAPGLGIVIDEAKLARYRLARPRVAAAA